MGNPYKNFTEKEVMDMYNDSDNTGDYKHKGSYKSLTDVTVIRNTINYDEREIRKTERNMKMSFGRMTFETHGTGGTHHIFKYNIKTKLFDVMVSRSEHIKKFEDNGIKVIHLQEENIV